MATCDECGKHENMPYQCRRCGDTFCAEHRLPENHDCIYQSMADAPSTKGVSGSATESSTWAGVRDVLAGKLPGSSDDDSTDSESTETSSTQKKTPPRKDTSDPDRVTWGSSSTPPDRSNSYPDDGVSRTHPAEAATSRAPGTRRDEPTAKSPDVKTKQTDDAGHNWPIETDSDYPSPGRFWRATVFVLKLAVLAGLGYGAALYLGVA